MTMFKRAEMSSGLPVEKLTVRFAVYLVGGENVIDDYSI
jgi:hypothetical protein